MKPRSMQIITMALLYVVSNLDDVIEAFTIDEAFQVNGKPCVAPTEDEIEEVLNDFQDVL